MDGLWRDLKVAVRSLAKRPGLLVSTSLVLALGIGANTAVYSFINALIINPLPFKDLNRIVAIWDKSENAPHNDVTFAEYLDWNAQQSSFESMAIYRWWSANISAIDPPERVQGFLVSPSLFDVLGVKPAIGRGFQPDEDQPGKDAVAILSNGLWRRRFGADPEIAGKTITVNGIGRTVVGVMAPDYNFPRGGDLLAPLTQSPERILNRRSHEFLVVGRLRDDTSLERAQADLDSITMRLEQQYPVTNTGWSAGVYTLLSDTVRLYRSVGTLLMAAVGFVLLIACANVANLMLSRGAGRLREVAIRSALGAGRRHIVRQLLTESVLLALTGGALGILFGMWGVDLMRSFIPTSEIKFVPGWDRIGIDTSVLAFTLILSIVTGLLFGLAPALQLSRPNLVDALKDGSHQLASRRNRLRTLLVVTEVALSMSLLVGSGLMIKSFWLLLKTNPGFQSDDVLTMGVDLSGEKYKEAASRADFHQELMRRLEALPGVKSAAAINHLPLGGSSSSSSFLIEGTPQPPPGQEFQGRYRVCTPDYFRTLGIEVIRGRGFTEQDNSRSVPVVIVSETLANRFWPSQDPVGRRMRFTGSLERHPWMEVVGVVNDVRHELDLPFTSDYYLPYAQDPWSSMVLAARTLGDPLVMTQAIREQIQAIDRDLPVFDIRTMKQVRSQSTLTYSIAGTWMSIFALIALILAAVGLYGVISYGVSQRVRDIGIRVALGARSRDVVNMVVKQGMLLTFIGLAIGLVGGWALSRAMTSLLYGVSGTDWTTYVTTALLLAVVSFAACCLPARRASRVDPIVALRYE
jgi:putative ABC transport system permease protein